MNRSIQETTNMYNDQQGTFKRVHIMLQMLVLYLQHNCKKFHTFVIHITIINNERVSRISEDLSKHTC